MLTGEDTQEKVGQLLIRLSHDLNALINYEGTPASMKQQIRHFEEDFLASAVIESVFPPPSLASPRKENTNIYHKIAEWVEAHEQIIFAFWTAWVFALLIYFIGRMIYM